MLGCSKGTISLIASRAETGKFFEDTYQIKIKNSNVLAMLEEIPECMRKYIKKEIAWGTRKNTEKYLVMKEIREMFNCSKETVSLLACRAETSRFFCDNYHLSVKETDIKEMLECAPLFIRRSLKPEYREKYNV